MNNARFLKRKSLVWNLNVNERPSFLSVGLSVCLSAVLSPFLSVCLSVCLFEGVSLCNEHHPSCTILSKSSPSVELPVCIALKIKLEANNILFLTK